MPDERRSHRLEELSWPQAEAALAAGAIAIIPIGSLEQHGRHLALNTDNVLADAFGEAVAERAAARGVRVLVCPSVHYGYTMHNMDFPGTMTLRLETLLALGEDLATSLVHHGCRKIILMNFHGSNWSVLDLISRRVMNRHPEALVASVSPVKMAAAQLEALREAKEMGGMSHACELETSLMLFLRPELVQMDLAVRDISQPESRFYWRDILRGSRGVAMADLTRHASRTGVVGDPTLATAEKGKQFFEIIATTCEEFVEELAARTVEVTTDFPVRHERTDIFS
jgi:creatinine amidohydrolase